jgi:hypothetical protein
MPIPRTTARPRPATPVATALGLAALLAVAASPAWAGSLRQEWVAADATWLAHLDVEALADSDLGRMVLEHPEDLDIDLGGLDELRDELGIDVRTDLFSLTAYGRSGDLEDDGVVIAVTNDRIDEAMERIHEIPDAVITPMERDGYEFDELAGEDPGDDVLYVHVRRTRGDRRIAVLSGEPDQLVAALRVIDGDAPARSTRDRRRSAPRRGSIVFIAVHEVDAIPELDELSEIARLAEAVTIDIGEHDGHVFGAGSVRADDEEDAANVADVIQGMIALGRLIGSQDEELAPLKELAGALDVQSDGRTISLSFEYETRRLMRDLEKMD